MNPSLTDTIKENYTQVKERIGQAAQSVGRDPDEIRVVVVTKGHPATVARAAIQAGIRRLGENYVREGLSKMELLSDYPVEWHMVGHVQSRKAKDVCRYYAWLHSLDRLKIAEACNKYAARQERVLPVLLECNVSGEESKYGWPAWDDNRWPELSDQLSPVFAYENIEVRGLMTMPPFNPDPEMTRPFFQRLRRLRDYLAERFPETALQDLSMGMSNDYEIAVQEGATLVRVGTAIVGPRP